MFGKSPQAQSARMLIVLIIFRLEQPLVTLKFLLSFTVSILVLVVSLLFLSMIYTVFKYRNNPCILSRSPKLILIEDAGKRPL